MEDESRLEAGTLRILKQKIQHLEGFKPETLERSVVTGLACLDEAFPNRSFPISAVHEFAAPRRQMSAALGFASSLMARIAKHDGHILWITKSREVFPPGLALFGLEPHRIIFMSVGRDQDALWAMEEGLRCRGLCMAVVEVADADLTATRRLQLAVEKSGVTGFVLRTGNTHASSAYFSQWSVSSLASQAKDGLPGVGHPRWRVVLNKIRNGQPGIWDIEFRAGELHEIGKRHEERHKSRRSLFSVAS